MYVHLGRQSPYAPRRTAFPMMRSGSFAFWVLGRFAKEAQVQFSLMDRATWRYILDINKLNVHAPSI